jgi:hypothetical protein
MPLTSLGAPALSRAERSADGALDRAGTALMILLDFGVADERGSF